MMTCENLGHAQVPNGTQSCQAVVWAKLKRMGRSRVEGSVDNIIIPPPPRA